MIEFIIDDEYSNSSGKGKIKSATGSSLDCSWCPLVDMHDPSTQKIVSFSIGLLHGVAGPGGNRQTDIIFMNPIHSPNCRYPGRASSSGDAELDELVSISGLVYIHFHAVYGHVRGALWRVHEAAGGHGGDCRAGLVCVQLGHVHRGGAGLVQSLADGQVGNALP